MTEHVTVIASERPRVVFRADGNSRIGLGHVVRSLALAQMLQGEFRCVFAVQAPEEGLARQLRKVCEEVIVLPELEVTAQEAIHFCEQVLRPTDVVVLDGYHFDTAYQQVIKSHGCALLCLDDIHAYSFVADTVLNIAGGVEKEKYKSVPYTRLLLGPAYALLRPPFLEASRKERGFPEGALRLLLNLGGADPENHTLRLAKELSEQENLHTIDIVVGGAYQHLEELQKWLSGSDNVTMHQNLDAEEMCRLMQRCAVAVTSASGVAYEYAAVGGLLYVLQTAGNQAGLYHFLTSSGVAQKYELLKSINPASIKEAFTQQVQEQRRYFDGKSPERLLEEFRKLSLSACLTLRQATEEDLLLIYHWNNAPEVRRQSFNSEPIPLANHQAWFRARLADKKTPIYIAQAQGVPLAQIRFILSGSTATLSYLIDKNYRGKGLGHTVLLKGVEKLRREHPEVMLIEGLVRQDNIASVRAFEKAGFAYAAPDPEHPEAHRFVLELERIKV